MNLRRIRPIALLLAPALVAGVVWSQASEKKKRAPAPPAPIQTLAPGAVAGEPVPGIYLSNSPGLDQVLDPSVPGDDIVRTGLIPAARVSMLDGKPVVGAGEHAALAEAQRFYDRMEAAGKYAPGTFEAWKARYGFPARAPGESLDDFRKRTRIVVYYNENELGLGRELGCVGFDDPLPDRTTKRGVACYVTNYGATFNNYFDSTQDAVFGRNPRNTVCIAYIPSLPDEHQVQFFVYDGSGKRQGWAQLDQLGPRPHPFICTNCHGGTYEAHADADPGKPEVHLARNARFLPVHPSRIAFPRGRYDRARQEEALRAFNEMAYGTGASGDPRLTDAQREALEGLYNHDGGTIHTPFQTARDGWAPAAWAATPRDREMFSKVADPYCITCHNAVGDSIRSSFATPAAFNPLIQPEICGGFRMPNAQQTMHRLWEYDFGDVTVDGKSYPAPADALLDYAGANRGRCDGYATTASCIRDGAPHHELCGNDHSGTVCSSRGTCGKDLTLLPTLLYAAPVGYCQSGGPRHCPSDQICRPLPLGGPDLRDAFYDSGCYACGALDRPPCQHTGEPTCNLGLAPVPDGTGGVTCQPNCGPPPRFQNRCPEP